jgi:hypothetical protein
MLASADVGARAYLSARLADVVTVDCEDVSDDSDIEAYSVPDPVET